MKERVIEILRYVADRVLSGGFTTRDVRQLIHELVETGYSLHEIDAAFTLIFSLPDMLVADDTNGPAHSSKALRIFSATERAKLALSAQGYLLRLMEHGLLSPSELEDVVNAAMQLESDEVGIPELKWLFPQILSDEWKSSLLATEPTYVGGEQDGHCH